MKKMIAPLILCFTLVTYLFTLRLCASSSITQLPCTADTYINDGQYAQLNYHTATSLVIKDGTLPNYTRKSLLKFSIENLDMSTLNKVMLTAKAQNVESNESIPISCYGISSNWNASSITWDNNPITDEELITTTSITHEDKLYQWDVTTYVQAQIALGVHDIAFMLSATDDSNRYVLVQSLESDDPAYLEITLENSPSSTPIADAYTRDGNNADTNFGDVTPLITKDGLIPNYTRYGYFKFDISTLSLDQVGRVFLKLYGENSQAGVSQINAFSTSSDWDESTLTWNNQPPKEDYLDTIFVNDKKYYQLDITAAVITSLENNQTTVSILIAQKENEDKSVLFDSRESASHKPELIHQDAYSLVFEDNFEGTAGSTMNSSKWEYRGLGPRRDAVNTEESVYLDGDGHLILKTFTADKGNGTKHYTGMIRTIDEWKFGKFEARIDFDSTPGMWSAFWVQSDTLGNPLGNPGLAGVEIDVVEHLVNALNTSYMNLHWDGYGSHHKSKGSTYSNIPISQGFHTFTLEWDADKYKFFIDGQLAWVTDSPISLIPEYIILSSEIQNNSWAGTIPPGGYGDFNQSTTQIKIDYVKVYQ